jgi:hypothetical protein
LAEALVASGAYAVAQPHFEAAIRAFSAGGIRAERARTQLAWTRACLRNGNIALARDLVREAAAEFVDLNIGWEVAQAQTLIRENELHS